MSQGSPPNVSQEELQKLAAELAKLQASTQVPAPNGYSVRQGPQVIDLDEQLARIDVSPQPVKIGGHVYMVRRDFTAAQANQLVEMLPAADKDPEVEVQLWELFVGAEDARRLKEFTDPLPMSHTNLIGQQIAAAAGLRDLILGQGPLGEA